MPFVFLAIPLFLKSVLLPPGEWIDLSYAYSEESVYWPTAAGFELEFESHQYTEQGYFYAANSFATSEHGGTHLDAPIHFAEGMQTTEQIPLERLIGDAIVIDVSGSALQDRDYQAPGPKSQVIPAPTLSLSLTPFSGSTPPKFPVPTGCPGEPVARGIRDDRPTTAGDRALQHGSRRLLGIRRPQCRQS